MVVPAIEREWYCVQCPRVPFTVNDRIDIIFSVVKIPHGPATNVIFLNCPLTTRYGGVSGVCPGGRDACRKRRCWVMDANDVWRMYLYRTCTLESTPVFDGSSQISIVGRKEKGNDRKDKAIWLDYYLWRITLTKCQDARAPAESSRMYVER